MHGLASQLSSAWHFLALALSALAIGAFTFTNNWFTSDEEVWTVLSVSTDTQGVLTFKNTNYQQTPEVILVPTDATFYAHQFSVGTTASAITALINQITLAGTGACQVIVRRRR